MSSRVRSLALTSAVAVLAVIPQGCGGSSHDGTARELGRQEQLRHARAQGARGAREDERIKELEGETRGRKGGPSRSQLWDRAVREFEKLHGRIGGPMSFP